LLRFITKLTRLPNAAVCPDFMIRIDQVIVRQPDLSLPPTSICFNLLNLRAYSNDAAASSKILYAMRSCQTMENE
jgi:hypothetical protein